jgi:type IV pilus assembly protein PilE
VIDMRTSQNGVTLIELITVVVIVAILAAIAVPSYRSYVLRSQRTDATTALLRIQSGEEKFLVQNGKYTDDMEARPADGGLGLPSVSEQGFYNLDVQLTNTGYEATATVENSKGQKDDKTCQKFTVNEAGKRTAVDSSATDRTVECWR